MKKKILGLAMIAAITCSISTGCSSKKSVSGSDTTMKDSSKMATPVAAPDTMKKDTMKKDTVHH